MKFCLKILALAVIAATTYSLTSCSAPSGFSYQNVSVSLSTVPPSCTDCPAGITYNPAFPAALTMTNTGEGGTILFTATIANAPATNVTWSIYPQPNLGSIDTAPSGTSTPVGESGSQVGNIVTASGNTVYYSESSVPIYGGAALVQAQSFPWVYNGQQMVGIPQGDILLVASVPSDPNNPSAMAYGYQLLQIYGTTPSVYLTPRTPTIPAGLTNPVVTVARNTTFQFYGGVVGAPPCLPTAGATTCAGGIVSYTTDNSAVWEVGPVPFSLSTAIVGGNATLGTISPTGLYTAPAAIPNPLPIVYLVPHAAPSVYADAYIGVN